MDATRKDWIVLTDAFALLGERRGLKGKNAGKDFVENRAERKDVAAHVKIFVPGGLLGREVAGRAEHFTEEREAIASVFVPCKSEIKQLGLKVSADKNVCRL